MSFATPSLQDPAYPLMMYQLLQECWQHELYNRPTAASLKRGIEAHTGLAPDGHCSATPCPLLDTLVLPSNQKVVTSCVHQDKDSFRMGVALVDGKDATSISQVVVISHNGGGGGGGGGGGVDLKLQLHHEVG